MKSTTKAAARPIVERMSIIHRLIAAGKYPNATTLAGLLEVSARCVGRDIEFLRDRLMLPLEYDERRYGYYYTEPVKCCLVCQQALPEVQAAKCRSGDGDAAQVIQDTAMEVMRAAASQPTKSARETLPRIGGSRFNVPAYDHPFDD
jgi:hypothetical protein